MPVMSPRTFTRQARRLLLKCQMNSICPVASRTHSRQEEDEDTCWCPDRKNEQLFELEDSIFFPFKWFFFDPFRFSVNVNLQVLLRGKQGAERGVYERGAQQRALSGSSWCWGSGWVVVSGWLSSLGVEWWHSVGGHIECKGGRISETSHRLLNWIYCALNPPPLLLHTMCAHVFLDRVFWVCVSIIWDEQELLLKITRVTLCFLTSNGDLYFQTTQR